MRFFAPILQPSRRLIKIRVLRNGNKIYKGVIERLDLEKYEDLEALLHKVTEDVRVDMYVPWFDTLFTMNGRKVWELAQLENDETYVAACPGENFKAHELRPASAMFRSKFTALPPRTPLPPTQAGPRSTGVRPRTAKTTTQAVSKVTGEPPCTPEVTTVSTGTQKTPTITPRLVTVVRDGPRPRRMIRFLLNRRTAPSVEHVLSTISKKIELVGGPLHTLFSQSGVVVSQLGDLFGKDHVFFAFTHKLDYQSSVLKLDQKEIEALYKMATRRRPKELKVTFSGTQLEPYIQMKYKIGKMIGTGTTSVCYRCSLRDSNGTPKYAMKVTTKTKANHMFLNNEVILLKALSNENIMHLIAIFDEPTEMYMVLELLTSGTLFSRLQHARIGEEEAKRFTANLVSAISYVHSKCIVHRNVSTQSVMITRDKRGERSLKLCDFRFATQTKPLYEVCGNRFFMSPEMVRENGYNEKLDVWASGAVLCFMLTQRPPIMGENDEDDQRLIIVGDINVPTPTWKLLPAGARDLLKRMLCVEVDSRYTTEQVLNHPWITGSEFVWGDDESDSDGDSTAACYGDALGLEVPEQGEGQRLERDLDDSYEGELTPKVGKASGNGEDELPQDDKSSNPGNWEGHLGEDEKSWKKGDKLEDDCSEDEKDGKAEAETD